MKVIAQYKVICPYQLLSLDNTCEKNNAKRQDMSQLNGKMHFV